MPSRLTLCCLRPVLNPDGDDEFYRVLEAPKNATEKVIKKQHRVLSLRLHPDKLAQRHQAVTDEDRQKFVRLQEAYDCLVDPRKRRLYDSLGELGLQLNENPTSVSPQTIVKTVAKVGNRCRCMIVSFILFIVVFFAVLFPLLLSLNVDQVTSISWAVVWVPLWVLDAFFFLYHVAWVAEGCSSSSKESVRARSSSVGEDDVGRNTGAPAASDGPQQQQQEEEEASPHDVEEGLGEEEEEEQDGDPYGEDNEMPMWVRLVALLQVALVVAFQILLVIRLDSSRSEDGGSPLWAVVFAPLFSSEAISLAQCGAAALSRAPPPPELPNVEDAAAAAMMEDEERQAGFIAYLQTLELRDVARREVRTILLRVAFEALVVVALAKRKGDDETLPTLSYWIVFIPVWILALLALWRAFNLARAASAISASVSQPDPAKLDGDDAADDTPADQAKKETASEASVAAASSCCSCLLLVVFGVLTVLRCDDSTVHFSALILFIPIFAVAACCFCCTCTVVCCFRDVSALEDPHHPPHDDDDDEDDEAAPLGSSSNNNNNNNNSNSAPANASSGGHPPAIVIPPRADAPEAPTYISPLIVPVLAADGAPAPPSAPAVEPADVHIGSVDDLD